MLEPYEADILAILDIIAKFRKADEESYGYDAAVDALDAIEKICLVNT